MIWRKRDSLWQIREDGAPEVDMALEAGRDTVQVAREPEEEDPDLRLIILGSFLNVSWDIP